VAIDGVLSNRSPDEFVTTQETVPWKTRAASGYGEQAIYILLSKTG